MILSVLNFYHGSSGLDGQSEPLHPGSTGPGGQIAARAAFELVEQGARAFLVSVDLPVTGEFVISGLVFNKAAHVLRRIAEEQADLVREAVLLALQTIHQAAQATGRLRAIVTAAVEQAGRIQSILWSISKYIRFLRSIIILIFLNIRSMQ